MAEMRIKLKRVLKVNTEERWNLEKLKDDNTAMDYRARGNLRLEVACVPERESMNINEKWNRLKEVIKQTANETLGQPSRRRSRKPWVTVQMIEKMEERRKWKNDHTDEGQKRYKFLNNQLRRETDAARQKWWDEQCREMEELDKKGLTDKLYKKVKELSKKSRRSKNIACIQDKNGKQLTETTEICERWKEYIEDLYDKDNKPQEDTMILEKG